jgi:hypothetical protein
MQNAIDDTDVLVTICEYDEDGARQDCRNSSAGEVGAARNHLGNTLTEDTDDIATAEDLAKRDLTEIPIPEYFFL